MYYVFTHKWPLRDYGLAIALFYRVGCVVTDTVIHWRYACLVFYFICFSDLKIQRLLSQRSHVWCEWIRLLCVMFLKQLRCGTPSETTNRLAVMFAILLA